jgi:hypothetical protein
MPLTTWIFRFLVAFVVAAVVLFLVQLLKGNTLESALSYSVGWGALASAVFTGVGYAKYRRSPACMTKPPKTGPGAA